MNKKWKLFIEDNEHYCPHCSPQEQDETYIATFALKEFLKENAAEKKGVEKNRASFILNAGYQWTAQSSLLLNPEQYMMDWSVTDWTIVTEKYAPSIRNITLEDVTKVRDLIKKKDTTDG